ncbi:hypothetical protein [Actinomycetospora flava]|uniref:Uncharacterized protein n=1 Tax=Actinomycetospora flava TaxID=3129232 RepID=A0ABU8MFN2_9PSEU
MTPTDHPGSDPVDSEPAAGHGPPGDRGAIGRLFAAALDGDTRAAAALHLLGGLGGPDDPDDTAHRASFALLPGHDRAAGGDASWQVPPDVLAGIDRALAAARAHHTDRIHRVPAYRPR